MYEAAEHEVIEPSGGRGRGRGGGGVPLLPEGIWDTLSGKIPTSNVLNERNAGQDVDAFINSSKLEKRFDDREDYHQYNKEEDAASRRGVSKSNIFSKEYGLKKSFERDSKGKDWDCPTCGNVNWSWRAQCNKCNTSKPVSILVESSDVVRDGAGSGFFERQDRASGTSVEITEDGFDDFGRRVKKTNRVEKSAKEEAALKRLSEKYKHLLPGAEFEGSSSSAMPAAKTVINEPSKSESISNNSSSNRNTASASSVQQRHDCGRMERQFDDRRDHGRQINSSYHRNGRDRSRDRLLPDRENRGRHDQESRRPRSRSRSRNRGRR